MSPQYTRQPPLDEGTLDPDPLEQLARWLKEAKAAGMVEPTAMTIESNLVWRESYEQVPTTPKVEPLAMAIEALDQPSRTTA